MTVAGGPQAEVEVEVTTVRRSYIKLSGTDVLNLLRNAGHVIPENAKTTVHFHVPGGGDWSNDDIAIDHNHPVFVEWVTETAGVI